jgi:hypothetical protein
MAHDKGSFSYKIIDEKLTEILNNRSVLDNTIQVAQPFIKATTTIQLPSILGGDCIGFSLGLHAIEEDVRLEDMYSETYTGNAMIVYTYNHSGGSV